MKFIRYSCLFAIFAAATLSAATVQSVIVAGNSVRISLGQDVVVVAPLNDNTAAVEYQVGGQPHLPSETIDSSLRYVTPFPATDLSANPVRLSGASFVLVIYRNPFVIEFTDKSGRTLFKTDANNGVTAGGMKANVIPGSYYGGFNRPDSLGAYYATWQSGGGLGNLGGGARSPFLWTPQGFGFLWDSENGSFDRTPAGAITISRGVCQSPNNLFFLICGNPPSIMQSFYRASGAFPMPPRWSMGFINGEWGDDQKRVVENILGYRSRQIGLDAYIFGPEWCCWSNTFPSGQSGQLGRFFDSTHVTMLAYRNFPQLDEAHAFDPAVQFALWNDYITAPYRPWENGIRGLMLDEADHGHPFINLYVTKSNYLGQRSYAPQRVWSVNRSFCAGMNRYAGALWSGDINCEFSILASQRAVMLSSVNLGESWWTMDLGGFGNPTVQNPTNELYIRWMQSETFAPFLRTNSWIGQRRQPWAFGSDAERISKRFIQLRYRLIPYLYSAFWRLHNEGLPPVRALIMDYPDDPGSQACISSWMFGDCICVNPVVASNPASVQVYLPPGNWIDFWTGRPQAGGREIALPAALDSIPLFVKAGSVIPLGPIMNYTGEKLDDPLELRIYPGADGGFSLHEDDNSTYAYEQGAFSTIPFRWSESAGIFTAGDRQGSFAGMLQKRRLNIVFVSAGHGVGETVTLNPDATIEYSGISTTVSNRVFRLNADTVSMTVQPGQISPAQAISVTNRSSSALPTLSVRADSGWLTAAVSGSGNNQIITVTSNPGSRPSGIYFSRIAISAAGFNNTICIGKMIINGFSTPASIDVTPSSTLLKTGASLKMTARILDQFGNSIQGNVNWATSGGGTISGGLFVSNGTVGDFSISGSLQGNDTIKGTAMVLIRRYVPGLVYQFYPNSNLSSVDPISGLSAKTTRIVPNFGTYNFDLVYDTCWDNFAIRCSGYIKIPAAGQYSFSVSSDDGSKLIIDGTTVVNNDGLHGIVEQSGTVQLTAGYHPMVGTYFDASLNTPTFIVKWQPPNSPKTVIPDSVLFRDPDSITCLPTTTRNAPASNQKAFTCYVLIGKATGTQIRLAVPAEIAHRNMEIRLFDMQGRLAMAIECRNIQAGVHSLQPGTVLSNGGYLLQVRAGNFRFVRTISIVH